MIHGDSREKLSCFKDNTFHSVVTDPPYALDSVVRRFGKAGSAPAKSDGPTGVYERASARFVGQTWDTGDTAFSEEFWREVLRVLRPGGHLLAFGGTRTYHRLAVAIESAGFDIRDQMAWVYGTGFPKSHEVAKGVGSALKPAWEPIVMARKNPEGTLAANWSKWQCGGLGVEECRGEGGRFPTNLAHDGSDEVAQCLPEGAPRFFWSPKASKKDRDTNGSVVNTHGTVKPSALMSHYVSLVTTPGGLVLDPFAGSGSTGVGALLAGRKFVGIERDATFVSIATARLHAVRPNS